MALKTVASLGKEKYERIGATNVKEILRRMDYMTRSKLKIEARNLGTSRISILNFAKKINKTHGAVAASKFIGAAQKHFDKGVDDPKIKERNLRYNKAVDRTALEESTDRFDRNRTLASAGGGAHGDVSRLKTVAPRTQPSISALQKRPVNIPKPGPTPKAPLGGIKPLGL